MLGLDVFICVSPPANEVFALQILLNHGPDGDDLRAQCS